MNLDRIMENLPIILALIFFFFNREENKEKKVKDKKEAISNKEDSKQEFNIFQDISKVIEESIKESKKENLEKEVVNLKKKSPLIGPKNYNKEIYFLDNAQDYYKEKIEEQVGKKVDEKSKKLSLEKEDLLKGFIFSEVLSEPKCKKDRRKDPY